MKLFSFTLFVLFFSFFAFSFFVQAQTCPAYNSAFPPPYPETYPCMEDLFVAHPECCNIEFGDSCCVWLKQMCDDDGNPDNDCFFDQCKIDGCSSIAMPFCPQPCPSYTKPDGTGKINPPPLGGELPTYIHGVLFEIFMYEGTGIGDDGGFCCMDTWDKVCDDLLDNIATTVCDDGDPETVDGANEKLGCTHTPIPTETKVLAKMRVFLQGPYIPESEGMMHTELYDGNLLPAEQPFNTAPWNYTGTETMGDLSDLPFKPVDWVLIEARYSFDEDLIAGSAAGLLLEDGRVVSADGSRIDGLDIDGTCSKQ